MKIEKVHKSKPNGTCRIVDTHGKVVAKGRYGIDGEEVDKVSLGFATPTTATTKKVKRLRGGMIVDPVLSDSPDDLFIEMEDGRRARLDHIEERYNCDGHWAHYEFKAEIVD